MGIARATAAVSNALPTLPALPTLAALPVMPSLAPLIPRRGRPVLPRPALPRTPLGRVLSRQTPSVVPGQPAPVTGPRTITPGMRVASLINTPIDTDIEGALQRRLRRRPSSLLAGRHEVMVLDAGDDGQWSVRVAGDRIVWRAGGDRHPNAIVRADLEVLTAVVDGTLSGVQAFLEERLTIRGSLGLAMALDGMFIHPDRPDTWARSNSVVAGSIRTAHVAAGPYEAPPVIILHGLGATNASVLPLVWELAADHRVYAPDMPGFGDTAAPHVDYTSEFFAGWLADYMDAIGVGRCAVIGNSLGGRVAIEAGLTMPDRVSAVVGLCPSPAFRRIRQLAPVVRYINTDLAAEVIRYPHALVVQGIRLMFALPDRLPGSWFDAAADEFGRVTSHHANRRAFASAGFQIYLEEAYGEKGFWERLPQLSPPALFLWGDSDRLVPSRFERHVRGALPQSQNIVMENSGHVPQCEHPIETADLVRAFLREHA